ncbi:MAG: carbohydrate ABC transporter permease, partial [Clostridia bacterium]|nr:carbohydrate ABC transporter permease [Clostridia bacterium]
MNTAINNRRNRVRQSSGDRIFDFIVTLIGVLIMLSVLIPLIFVLSASFSDPDLVLRGKVLLIPKGITFRAYTLVFENRDIWIGYRNTVFYTVAGTAINILLTIMAAYPLSRKEMVGRRFFTLVVLFTMYFNGGLIPTYLLVRNLGMYNTAWA